ncbi:MAG: CAP domain-containing protein [Sandaracinaceae bacterium]
MRRPPIAPLVASALAIALFSPASGAAQDCTPDEVLGEVAALLVLSGERSGLLDRARRAGSDVPVVEMLTGPARRPARRRAFLARVAADRQAPLVCGEAQGADRWVLLAAPRAGRLVPLPDGALAVELAGGWTDGEVVVVDDHGTPWRRPVRAGEVVDLPADLVSPVAVQLLATGPRGPVPVAELRLGITAPRRVTSDEPDPDVPTALRRLRSRAGRRALRTNALLGRLAEEHAERVCEARQVAHVLPAGEDPEGRLARAGLEARHVGEAIARADTVAGAVRALEESPSHRLALLDRRFTDVGVGQAQDEAGRDCLVVLLAAWPRRVGTVGLGARSPARPAEATPRSPERQGDPDLEEPRSGGSDEER